MSLDHVRLVAGVLCFVVAVGAGSYLYSKEKEGGGWLFLFAFFALVAAF